MYKHILVATDGSDAGQKAIDHGLALAASLGARLAIITVTEPFPLYAGNGFGMMPTSTMMTDYESGQQEMAKSILTEAGQTAKSAGIEADTVHVADAEPAESIIEAAKSRNCDLIVMGSHGRRGVGRLLLGSKTSEVIAHTHIPVLVVR